MSVEHSLPSTILPLIGSSYGVFRPGQTVTHGDSGPIVSRDWFEYNIRKYKLDMAAITLASDLEALETFWHHIRSGGAPFWYKEVSSTIQRDLLCGPLADGTQTSFPLPVVSPSDVTVFDAGIPQVSSTYTLHTAANVMSDNMASFETSITGWAIGSSATISRVTGISADGIACMRVRPDGEQANIGPVTSAAYRPAVSASQLYKVVVSIHGPGNFKIGTLFYNSGGACLPTGVPADDRVWTDNQACTDNGWTQITAAATSQATAATLEISLSRTTSSAYDYYVDCVGVVPGDLARWYLPSISPGVIQFGSARVVNHRITASATGYRLTRVRADSREPTWSYNLPYHVTPSDLTLVEDIEI